MQLEQLPAGHGTLTAVVTGRGRDLVVLHSLLADRHAFDPVLDKLAEKHRVTLINLPGFDGSVPTPLALMDAYIAAIEDGYQEFGIGGDSIRIGNGGGGTVALAFALAHPDRVAKLFVFGANYNSEGSKPRSGRPSDTFNAYAAKCRADYAKLSKTPKEFNELVDWLLPVWRTPMGFTKDQLRALEAPTLVADGDHDEVIVPDQIREMATLIPNAQLAVIPDTSHFALWQAPEAFNKALLDFLAK